MISDVQSPDSEKTLEQLKLDYANTCAQAGDIQYIIKEQEAVLAEINQKLFELKKSHIELEAKIGASQTEKIQTLQAP